MVQISLIRQRLAANDALVHGVPAIGPYLVRGDAVALWRDIKGRRVGVNASKVHVHGVGDSLDGMDGHRGTAAGQFLVDFFRT